MNWQTRRGQNAVVIGAGPAGTCAAMYLARRGYQVDVYERRAPPEVDQVRPGILCVLSLCQKLGAATASHQEKNLLPWKGFCSAGFSG